MRSLAEPATLLEAWEQASRVPSPARAAVLVHHAGLTSSLDEALDLDVGRCAAFALRVFRETFGEKADAVAACPRCGELLEAALPTADASSSDRRVSDRRDRVATERVVGDKVVRAPTSRDLLLVSHQPDVARQLLLVLCVRNRLPDGAPFDPATVAPEELAALEAAAEELAGAGSQLSVVTCPACGERSEVAFDAGAVLWDQVAQAAPALLTDVVILAREFGWSEAEVFAMPEVRRRAYLELATR